tara:strand:+ start:890 stop:1006 length:117 start_codon:yes stop_codon:yes gene_type:complete
MNKFAIIFLGLGLVISANIYAKHQTKKNLLGGIQLKNS